jgi:lipoyl-dependent peroxiredoxin subunit D
MVELTAPELDKLKESLPAPAKDLRLNLGTVLRSESLTAEQLWGVALASAYWLREPKLRDALLADARAAGMPEGLIEDAQAAAAIMAMNTVFYRSRHMLGKDSYTKRPAGLRTQYMASPKTGKASFELCSLAVAALAGCEACLKSHEASVLKVGLGEEHVHEVIRLAGVLAGVAVALNF